MLKIMNREKILLVLIIIIGYISIGTGIHSDDYPFLVNAGELQLNESINIILNNKFSLLSFPNFLLETIQAHLFYTNYIMYDIIKIIVMLISIYFIYSFSKPYMGPNNGLLFSLLFILFPIHETANLHPFSLYYILVPGLIMYGFHNISNGKLIKGIIFTVLGTFFSYGSLPYVFGLSLLFIFKKSFKKLVIFIFPQIIYITYYFYTSLKYNILGMKTGSITDLNAIIKQFIIQILSFLDSFIGPSFWLKVYISFQQLTVISIIIGTIITLLFYKHMTINKTKVNRELLISFIGVVFCGFGIYSLTGILPQIVFGLGNRVTTYGSLLISLLIVYYLMNSKNNSVLVFTIFIFSLFGITDHWKKLEIKKNTIMYNVKNNKQLNSLEDNSTIYISHNMYSKFGPISNIEIFTESSPNWAMFKIATGKDFKIVPLNSRCFIKKSNIIDPKKGIISEIIDPIKVYNTNEDKLYSLSFNQIAQYIDLLPEDKRHWIQYLSEDHYIRKLAIFFMPRIDYIF